MSQPTCRTCAHGCQEQTSRNGSPPAFRQACDLGPYRVYPTRACEEWAQAQDVIDTAGRGDSGNHI